MPAIRTIETDPQSPFGEPEIPAAEWTLRFVTAKAFERGLSHAMAWLASCGTQKLPTFPQGRSLERTVLAYVNHGRWLWDCALCGAAQCCTPNDPRAYCVACFNRGDGWWPVEFPEESVMAEAILLLERRPNVEQQNWQPAREPIEELMLENLSIGIDPNTPNRIWPGADDALALARSFHAERALSAAPRRELDEERT